MEGLLQKCQECGASGVFISSDIFDEIETPSVTVTVSNADDPEMIICKDCISKQGD